MSIEKLPLIALTMGDPAGIGPEVLVRAAADDEVRSLCRPVAVGHSGVLQQSATRAGLSLELTPVEFFEESAAQPPHMLSCVNPCDNSVAEVPIGRIDPRAGQAAYDCLMTAGRAALEGQVDAVTTAPLNKAALRAAGLNYPGHTEILGELCGVSEFGMMLYLPEGDIVRSPYGLGVVHTTLHTSIRSVPDLLSKDRISAHIRLMDVFMQRVGATKPRVGVCALNPHAGEDGLFGDEESRFISPAVDSCRHAGIDADGPIPADALFRRAVAGEFDGVVAMYHDQGHIALKLIGFNRAVNITLGLPIIRTSPSHGTAFDIAGTGRASAEGMIEAIKMAAKLAKNKSV